jgi:Phage integrase, N-terminal SAM-like domain
MAAPSLDDLPASFELYLRASNKSRRTIETYREALDGFIAHLQATKRPLDQARREDVEAWMTVLLARWKPATAHNRYRGLHASTAGWRRKRTSQARWRRCARRQCRNSRSRFSATSSCAPCSPSAPARTSTPAGIPRC